MTAVYTTSAFALSVQIPRINDDCLIGGVPAHDLVGIDIEASKERFDALILATVQAEYPGAEFGSEFRVCDQDGNADTAAAREASDWIANEAENLFGSGTFWVEETYPPIGGGSQELDTQYNGWTNYATWRVNLEVCEDLCNSYVENVSFESIESLAGQLKEETEEIVTNYGQLDGLAVDYAMAFLSDVDWYEIAKHWEDDLIAPDEDETS